MYVVINASNNARIVVYFCLLYCTVLLFCTVLYQQSIEHRSSAGSQVPCARAVVGGRACPRRAGARGRGCGRAGARSRAPAARSAPCSPLRAHEPHCLLVHVLTPLLCLTLKLTRAVEYRLLRSRPTPTRRSRSTPWGPRPAAAEAAAGRHSDGSRRPERPKLRSALTPVARATGSPPPPARPLQLRRRRQEYASGATNNTGSGRMSNTTAQYSNRILYSTRTTVHCVLSILEMH